MQSASVTSTTFVAAAAVPFFLDSCLSLSTVAGVKVLILSFCNKDIGVPQNRMD